MKRKKRNFSETDSFLREWHKAKLKVFLLFGVELLICFYLIFGIKNEAVQTLIALSMAIILLILLCKLIKKVWSEKVNGQLTTERKQEYWGEFLCHWLFLILAVIMLCFANFDNIWTIDGELLVLNTYHKFMIGGLLIINNAKYVKSYNDFLDWHETAMEELQKNSNTSDGAE